MGQLWKLFRPRSLGEKMVQPIKEIFFSLLFCFIYATSSFAMADFLDIYVMDFTSKGKDEYILIFKAADTRECNKANMQKKCRKHIVHLRHNPDVLTIGIQKADENPYWSVNNLFVQRTGICVHDPFWSMKGNWEKRMTLLSELSAFSPLTVAEIWP